MSTIRRLLNAAAIAMAMLAFAAAPALAQAPAGAAAVERDAEVDRLVGQIEALRATHSQLLARSSEQRAAFDEIVREVERLRSERDAAGQLADDTALRENLRRAHEAAESLRLRSAELRDLREETSALEARLVEVVNRRVAALEQGVREARGGELDAIIAELNGLNELLATYQEPLPEAPVVELDAILLGLGEDVDLDEVLATVDELSDNERRVLLFIAELDEEIGDLERRRELAERARRAERDSSLFEEGVNSGRGERSRARTGGASDSSGDSAESDADGTPTSGGAGGAEGGGDTQNETPVSAGGDGGGGTRGTGDEGDSGAPVFGNDGASAPEGGGGAEAPGGSFGGVGEDDGASDPSVPVTEPSDGLGGVIGGSDPDVEPTTSLPPALNGIQGSTSSSDPTLLWIGAPEGSADGRAVRGGSRLDELRERREEASSTLEQLRRHRTQLLERVEELQQSDDW